MLKGIKETFKGLMRNRGTKNDALYEVRLWGLEGESFNKDEHRAWEVMKEIYEEVLFDDENWHFFYENWYNIIRCSASFYPKLIKKLDSLSIYYKECGEWVDEQTATRKYQKIFQGMFHYFTLMALKEYDADDIKGIYDRVSHCFLNHQYYVLEETREKFGKHWEAEIMSSAMINRIDYNSYCATKGVILNKSNYINTSKKPLIDQVEDHLGGSKK